MLFFVWAAVMVKVRMVKGSLLCLLFFSPSELVYKQVEAKPRSSCWNSEGGMLAFRGFKSPRIQRAVTLPASQVGRSSEEKGFVKKTQERKAESEASRVHAGGLPQPVRLSLALQWSWGD